MTVKQPSFGWGSNVAAGSIPSARVPYAADWAGFVRTDPTIRQASSWAAKRSVADLRVGVICNAKAHRNLGRGEIATRMGPGALQVVPETPGELSAALAEFAARDVNVLVIDGGDGTVRDVITEVGRHYRKALPLLALVPSGKTNALALDLGIPQDWTIESALEAAMAGRITQRAPIEIWRSSSEEPDLRGFLFGAGGFVRATALAQRFHRFGAFNGLAVGLSLVGAVAQTLFGSRSNVWRRGMSMRIDMAGRSSVERSFYLLLGSTLERMPLRLKPFGAPREGFKLLGIDAPPKRIPIAVPALLAGSEAPWLSAAGYHHADTDGIGLRLDGDFILDGESYPGGELVLRKGAPLSFATP